MLPCNSDHCCLKTKLKLQKKSCYLCKASGFYHSAVKVFALLGCCTAYVGSLLPTFPNNILVPTNMCPEMSVINYTVVKFLKINIKKSYNIKDSYQILY